MLTPTTQPMTMPASWPPLNLFLVADVAAAGGLEVAEVVTMCVATTLPSPELAKMLEIEFESCTQTLCAVKFCWCWQACLSPQKVLADG